MAKLLCDLGKDTTKARPGPPLTQAALDVYEKQLRTDQCPASSSIISYLKRLEMDQVIPVSDQPDPSASTYQKGLTSDPSDDLIINYQRPEPTVSSIHSHSPQKLRPEVNSRSCSLIGEEYKPDKTTYLPLANSPHKATYQKGLTSDPSDDFIINYQRPEPTVSSIPSHSPQKLRPELNSRACSLIGDEYKPDETTYLPLASSPHKANFALMCTPPKICSPERDVGDKIKIFGASERNRSIQNSLFNVPDMAGMPTQTQDVQKPKEPSGGHPPPLHHLRNLRITDSRQNDQSAFDVMSAASDWSMASFSTFTSHDEQDFRTGLAALDANIAKLQQTLQSASNK